MITPDEAPVLGEKYGLDVNVIETVEGFSLTKGQNHALQIAVLRRSAANPARVESTAELGTSSNRS